jgi:hypothetical protein
MDIADSGTRPGQAGTELTIFSPAVNVLKVGDTTDLASSRREALGLKLVSFVQ